MRLLTRSDFDGLVCAVFLSEKKIVDEYKFVHPKDLQDGSVEVNSNDVLANVPYHKNCGLWFDHHASEEERLEMEKLKFEGASYYAASAAQVIWDYYGGEATFDNHFIPLLEAVNKTDSANLSTDEIVDARGWILLGFIMDPRTGLGRFTDYRISNYELMLDLIGYCRSKTAEEIVMIPDIQERTRRYFEQQELFEDMLQRNCDIKGNVIVTNLMNEETIYCGNRFLVYGIYPNQNIEVRVMWGKNKQNVVFAVGHSILNQTCRTNVGKLMLDYNGGGHERVGTCQVPFKTWEQSLDEIVQKLQENG
ncbi:MAG: exopolyphosphatase [Deltaproteobacteria bacterium]|jgi:nanoRNase/pAp phosphatase (c-di-AMP/oligoRNAs hydrolase)|nr:exopolyphosphatase [Deltaproteobacteria bacterium]MBT4092300.1 exopolyphosphatase [Deltaproteobacteria bacterium]MBT4268042.1 exopolyphosphatase [Deltaproteobacteria bacterium]MBT4641490.1 exopolyphosphatase [Deltaproteobacteria bacterium]MBT6500105.1 exopolyphosphatase [Deltaproteobacteria bacterium]